MHQGNSATAELSTTFSKYWQGDPVTIQVHLEGDQMVLALEHKGRRQRPSRRSSGMKWHLGFFVNFTAEVQQALAGAILLLDEPGLRLHIKQQRKLLELFDQLSSDGCRIIYSTHLSHMLPIEKPHTYRPLVADPKSKDAVVVEPNVMGLAQNSDVMQPVRQALGMGIADAIGLGGKNVVVEGWVDRYVLIAMSAFCKTKGLSHLSDDVSVLPAGGSGKKMLPLATMAVAGNTKAVVLVDDDKAGRETIGAIASVLREAVRVIRTHEEALPTDREIEDLLDVEYYVELVNSSYAGVPGFTKIDSSDVDTTKPIVNEIAAQLKSMKIKGFQKTRPALELHRRSVEDDIPPIEVLNPFSSLFDRINEALKSA
jgi:predicted ATP-dependent endonuclease of OLD family